MAQGVGPEFKTQYPKKKKFIRCKTIWHVTIRHISVVYHCLGQEACRKHVYQIVDDKGKLADVISEKI
jgi:hypothetical protein